MKVLEVKKYFRLHFSPGVDGSLNLSLFEKKKICFLSA
jgi:hypothetical protein